ncbi:MAG: AMP-binding protein [Treponema sp.]|uniref:AMP-binding protein n=3 Tax=unclassified Treponema TaxID=2638727 RepID=UPI0025F99C17|nr:AMP-binding protein [Treponema sp.]MBQ8679687.1 AMP-binding protein [Treponema sp.]
MNFYSDYVENGTVYTNYEDLKKNFKIKVPENFNFSYDIIDRYEKEAPNKRALVWCDDSGEERVFTFADIAKESRRTANYLVSKGIKKGDAVMLILRRRYEFWFFITALHRIGAIAVPATNQLLQKDLEYRTNAAQIKMIVSYDDTIQEEIEKALPASPSVKNLVTVQSDRKGWISYSKEISSFGTDFPRPQGEMATHNDDIMLLYFTSGTSGYPKMVQHNFAYPLGHIVTAKYWQNVIDDGLHLTVAETGWAKSVWGKLYGQWICGSAVFAYDMVQFKPGVMLKKIEQYKVTTFCAPPTVYNYLVRADINKYDLSSLKYLVTAGEALNPEVYKKVYEATGLKMFEAYGQTEATVIVGNFPGMEPKPGSMGKPAPGYDVAVVRPDGSKCDPKEPGVIVVNLENGRPFGLFTGYYHDEEKTKSVFENNKYLTGDTAYYDEDGYIWFIGRNDDVIKSSGYRVSPFEIESILQQHPAVLECAVTGVPDPRRGQAIKATIVLTKLYEASEQLRISILDWMKEKTASYKHPRIIEFVTSLPKTISGKIRRVEIRENDQKKE